MNIPNAFGFIHYQHCRADCCIASPQESQPKKCISKLSTSVVSKKRLRKSRKKTTTSRIRYDFALLQQVAERDRFDIKTLLDDWKLNRETRISCRCFCGIEFVRNFRAIYEHGGFCSANCAKKAGVYKVHNPCRNCPEDNKISASHPDEKGNPRRLCTACAKTAGVYKVPNACRDCPDDNKLSANYPDEKGNLNILCSTCATKANTHILQNACRDCPEDNKVAASHPDEKGNTRRLCTACAKTAGIYNVQNPCRDCPEDNKVSASHPDENGKKKRLCTSCAMKAGTYTTFHPCRDCPEDNKLSANHPDEKGNSHTLCSTCARRAGTYTLLKPCHNCPEGNKISAHYPDTKGNLNRLCATCAMKAGTYTTLYPCRDCPEDNKSEAHYPDEKGNLNKLCAACAVKAGTHVDTTHRTGASFEACRCFDRLERCLGIKLPHIHYLPGGGYEGREIKNLIPYRRFRPDSFVPDASGMTFGSVYFYHGSCHGYPPDHPLHETKTYTGRWGPDAYKETIDMQKCFIQHGYRVFVIWGYEFTSECERVKYPRNVAEICREFF